MQITFTGHHMDVTEALEQFTTDKLMRLKKHMPAIISINVTLGVEKQRQKAEAVVHVPGANLHASSEDVDMYTAVDSLYDKLKRRVDKHKDKSIEH